MCWVVKLSIISHSAVTTAEWKIDKGNGCGTKQRVAAIACFYNTINEVPVAMNAQPIRLLAVNGSCRMKNASASVMTTLSALESVLNYLKFPTTQGAAMQAAWDHYRSESAQ